MNLTHLQIFLDVVRLGSFAAVARRQDTDPSSISRQIAAIEAELGVRLFERTTRRLVLTEAGQLTFDRIQAPMEEIGEIRELARDVVAVPQGNLRVSTSVAFGERWLMPRLPAFRGAYPKIRLELILSDETTDLVADKIDLAIRLGARPSGPYVASKLLTTRYHLVASPAYLEKAGWPATPAEIPAHETIAFPFPGFRSQWKFRSARGRVQKIEIEPSLIVSNALALRRAALEGLGVALLSDWTIQADLAAGRLIDLFGGQEVTATDFGTAAWILYPSRSYVPAKTRCLIDYLKSASV
ncbi:LysR family transcriptional regulator [Denitrobaculum tricleocarpae]|uniref:LysR family transcriptional regulator n=1 Tax=Denitrobaculum tricleocarpae TaxID=2591009 RepID=A0A545TF73_9PROT|nr:LysR family transcriptional regulator [Denitrobaculum tricleocarpae]TQV75831.1 LysR family transcriptional regulator [Denitrobaculum tricleocarpae]